MLASHLATQIPLDRYRGILGALHTERAWHSDGFWLRIAAHAAVLCPDPPEQLAHRIREIAAALREHTDWYRRLASPVRFVVAALLIQHHIPLYEFLGECARASELFHEAGLGHGGFSETMAVLILRLAQGQRAVSLLEVERIKAIYDHMKGYHWWLTGPHDLPACAALALCPGSAEVVAALSEAAFQDLYGGDLAKGRHLQTAANLLPVTGLPRSVAIGRYRALTTALEAQGGVLAEESYDALVVLTLLEQPAEAVIPRLRAIEAELDLLQPALTGSANFLAIAADLTFLDLVRFGRDHEALTEGHAAGAMLRSLHAFHLHRGGAGEPGQGGGGLSALRHGRAGLAAAVRLAHPDPPADRWPAGGGQCKANKHNGLPAMPCGLR